MDAFGEAEMRKFGDWWGKGPERFVGQDGDGEVDAEVGIEVDEEVGEDQVEEGAVEVVLKGLGRPSVAQLKPPVRNVTVSQPTLLGF